MQILPTKKRSQTRYLRRIVTLAVIMAATGACQQSLNPQNQTISKEQRSKSALREASKAVDDIGADIVEAKVEGAEPKVEGQVKASKPKVAAPADYSGRQISPRTVKNKFKVNSGLKSNPGSYTIKMISKKTKTTETVRGKAKVTIHPPKAQERIDAIKRQQEGARRARQEPPKAGEN
jgi:hypothetical protein